jgi:hypothetical protein
MFFSVKVHPCAPFRFSRAADKDANRLNSSKPSDQRSADDEKFCHNALLVLLFFLNIIIICIVAA